VWRGSARWRRIFVPRAISQRKFLAWRNAARDIDVSQRPRTRPSSVWLL